MKNLAEVFIRRPVLTVVLSLFITIFGLISYFRLPVREYPAVDPPTITVTTSYPGAAAEVIEAQITQPLEEAINSVAGIRTLNSTSREGSSSIVVEFTLETDLNTAASDVRDQISRAIRNLPADVNPPVINKANADSSPIFGLMLSSADRAPLELCAIADKMKERLQTVEGIASVDQPAEKRYSMRLWLDPEKLAAYGVGPLDVRQALNRENIELPSGRVEGESIELSVKTLSRLNTPAEFNDLVIKRQDDRIVRFRDVGYAELGAQNERAMLKSGNVPIAGLYFRQQPGANQIQIVDELRSRLERIRKELPPDVKLDIAYDNTEYVRRSIREVEETVLIAFGLVLLVVFCFFREWRTTLIPVLAIPVSIVGAFFLMELAGFSINILSLLGIVLAIGLVVDDAIVVLENIYAKIENGMPPVEAGITGTKEIFVAIVATTITLAVVFLPLLFMGGLSGKLFREFGVTVAGAVLISAIVALTLTPMLSTRILKAHGGHGWFFRKTEPFFVWLEGAYANSLRRILAHRWISLAVLAAASGSIYLLLGALPKELAPLEDRGRIWLRATSQEGVSFEYMATFMDDVAKLAAERIPETRVMMTQVPGSGGAPGVQGAVNSGFVRVFLTDKDRRSRSQQEIAADIQRAVRSLGGARVNITQEPSIGERRAGGGGAVQFVIQTDTLASLQEKLPQFLEEVRKRPEFSFVDSDLKFNKPELRLNINRDRAQALGISADDIARTLQAALSGQRFGYFILNGKQYEIIGQLTRDFRSRPGDLDRLSIRASTGELVRLDNLVEAVESSSPPELYRYNRTISATVSATLAGGRTMGEGIDLMQQIAARLLDDRFSTALTGAARDFVDSSQSLGYVFVLAMLFIYLVLAAQFESFRDPFVIMLTVPLALAGALFALWFCHQTLNIFSQIGLIMLIGLITKNGILIVEFANQRKHAAGGDPLLAVREAASARLRPILMTTLATILGILPVALALGAGAESRVSMGVGVIGGLIVGSLLTLYIIPAVYVLLHGRRRTAVSPQPAAVELVLGGSKA
ncbi:acriflavin resistance protein [Opitutaceae bacterium EW11]|nr:acriflavin resistance protein [Opitutaceae bacterium EW11]